MINLGLHILGRCDRFDKILLNSQLANGFIALFDLRHKRHNLVPLLGRQIATGKIEPHLIEVFADRYLYIVIRF